MGGGGGGWLGEVEIKAYVSFQQVEVEVEADLGHCKGNLWCPLRSIEGSRLGWTLWG